MMYEVILGLICFTLGFIFACYRIFNKYYSGEMEINDLDKINNSKFVLFKVKYTQK